MSSTQLIHTALLSRDRIVLEVGECQNAGSSIYCALRRDIVNAKDLTMPFLSRVSYFITLWKFESPSYGRFYNIISAIVRFNFREDLENFQVYHAFINIFTPWVFYCDRRILISLVTQKLKNI